MSYPIKIERGLFQKAGQIIAGHYKGHKIAIVTDENVAPIYGDTLVNQLKTLNFDVQLMVVPAGESSKSMDQLAKLYTGFIDFQLTRTDLIIALGGGVVGDLTGFAAATYLRGVSFVQIPTTLLAQIDSSVGGKVAVNVPQGKNLVGNFYHPEMVLIDPDVLKTLEKRVFNDGMAEVIKYGCIRDAKLYEQAVGLYALEDRYGLLEEMIYTCCDIKREIVENDELDKGERMLLNFGHTIGHGIEKAYGYKTFTHGEGVAVGMYMITQHAEALGLTEAGAAEKIKTALVNCHLPYEVDSSVLDTVRETILNDKKRKGNTIHLVLIKKIGESYLKQTDIGDISKFV